MLVTGLSHSLSRSRRLSSFLHGLSDRWHPAANVLGVDVFTFGDHRAFVETEGWEKAGERGGHINYMLRVNPPFAILRTGISHGADSTEYFAPGIRATIVHQQLHVTQAEFWACVREGQRPERRSDGYSVGLRGREDGPPPQQNPGLLRQLEREFGESPADVAGMSDTELEAYLALLWDRRAREAREGQ